MIDIKMDPDPEKVIQDFESLQSELQNKVLTGALTGAAKPVKDRMKQFVPVRGGALKRAIGHRQISKTAKARVGIPQNVKAVLVGPIRKVVDTLYKRSSTTLYRDPSTKYSQGYKAIWMEHGTESAGEIYPKKKKAMYLGGKIFYKKVKHEGATATHFMSRSFDAAGNQIPEQFYRAMAKRLDKLTRV